MRARSLPNAPVRHDLQPVTSLIVALDVVLAVVRIALFAIGVTFAVLALLSWAVRTRRIGPFSPVARFARGTVDPLFAPVERRLVRAGGQPSAAPWWTLAAVVVGGIVLVSLLGFVRNQLAMAAFALGAGPRGLYTLLVSWTFALLRLALLVRVVSSWFQLSPWSRWVRWAFVLTEWMLRPLRQILPTVGMLDLSPIVAYFALGLIEGLLLRGGF